MNTEAAGETARKGSAPHPLFSTPTARPLWLQPARQASELQLKFTKANSQGLIGYDEQAYVTKKYIHIYLFLSLSLCLYIYRER